MASASIDAHCFAGQVAIVTGGAQGIGFGIAEHLGALGATVVLFDVSGEKLEESKRALLGKGVHASVHSVNVTEEADWARALEAVMAAHGRVDILVQAAGITGKTGIKTHEVDAKNWDLVMAVNAKGIFLGCHAVLPYMLKANYGRIINIASIAGKEGNAGMLAYSASKGAVIALTKVVGKDYADTGITCNAVAPAVRTAMVDAMPAEQVKYMTDKIPMKRCGTISEIASLVAFIASKECSFTTGESARRGDTERATRPSLYHPAVGPPSPWDLDREAK